MRFSAGVAAAVLVLAGCGSAKKDPHKAFVRRLDAICKSDNARLATIPPAHTPSDVPDYVAKAVPIVQDESRRLASLPVPADQRENVAAAQRLLARQIAIARQAARLAAKGNTRATKRVADQIDDLHSAAQQLAKQMGSRECAK
jgi:hypothetical protein